MTQAELAQRVGVTRQTVIAIEQGRYSPSLEMAFRIARALDVRLDEVFQYPAAEASPTVEPAPASDRMQAAGSSALSSPGMARRG
jgi:putative transcriptional regulator